MALDVLDEANRCLGCNKPMCQQGCPIHTNIPEVIRLLKDNHLDDAGRMLFENNPLTTVCSLVCNHENQCEGHCVRNRMPSHDPVHFSIIEDYISTTYANKMTSGPAPKNGMKAAVVGSGPAGLTVAVLLARWGYDITIFDARDMLGGVMRYGIPNYRLPDSVLDDFQYRHLELKGIHVRPNTTILHRTEHVAVEADEIGFGLPGAFQQQPEDRILGVNVVHDPEFSFFFPPV